MESFQSWLASSHPGRGGVGCSSGAGPPRVAGGAHERAGPQRQRRHVREGCGGQARRAAHHAAAGHAVREPDREVHAKHPGQAWQPVLHAARRRLRRRACGASLRRSSGRMLYSASGLVYGATLSRYPLPQPKALCTGRPPSQYQILTGSRAPPGGANAPLETVLGDPLSAGAQHPL
jgi:hypothetical protein